jgi:hypothetical protein
MLIKPGGVILSLTPILWHQSVNLDTCLTLKYTYVEIFGNKSGSLGRAAYLV